MTFHLILTTVLLALLPMVTGSVAAASEQDRGAAAVATRTILILNSERAELPAIKDFEEGLREGISNIAATTQIFVEYLDSGRFPLKQHEPALVRHLQDRYAGRKIDVVVLFAESALDFMLARRNELFPGVPVIAAAIEHEHAARALSAGMTSIPVHYDYRRTVELALALQPDAREVVVVHGLSDFDERRLEEARRSVESFAPRLSHRLIGGVPLSAIEDEVRRLPPESLVLLVSMVRDAEGRPLAGRDYAGRLAAVSPVPVYGTFASHLAHGSLGGAINDFTEIGRATATVVAQVFSSRNSPPSATVVKLPPAPLRVNWRALERWHLQVSRVPAEAQIAFREPGLWEHYRHLVVAVLAILLLQGLLITGLLLQLERRRRAEAALRDSEARLKLAAEAAQIGMWGWDSSQEMWATENCRTLHGLAPDAALSFHAFTNILDREDRGRLRKAVQEALLERRAFAEEYRVTPPEGGTRWIATRGQGFYGSTADPLRVLGVCVDVTERKRSEEALRLALEALPTAILLVNEQGTIVLSNPQAQTLLGYQAAELAGQPVEILLPERFRDAHPGLRASFFSLPQARRMGAGRTLVARRKNGAEVPIEIGLNPVAAGDHLLVLAALTDLTERQELVRRQTELEHITRVATLGELAPSLAHELSQPLAAILSNAQAGLRLLDRGALDAAEMRDILQDVVAADKRAGDVIGVLRVLMRRGKAEQARVDVAQAVREVLGVLHGELVHEQVEVETALDGECVALASRTQLEQVLLNLITNAIEAMRPQPPGERRLRVTVSRTAERGTRVAIRDTGIGIAEGELAHVFEAFRTTKPHGLGMGLAVCRSIIGSLGGDIQAEPDGAPGITLVFTLPAAPPPAQGPPRAPLSH